MITKKSVIQELIDLDNKINIERPQINPNNLLYHYTDIEGLKGIIESNVFWLTRREFLNDAFEESYAKEILKTAYQQAYNNDNIAEESYEVFLLRFFDFCHNYILSFSIESDSIHQWSYYSDNDGYALGVRQSDLLVNVKKQRQSWKSGTVIYDKTKQIEYLTDLLKLLKCVEKSESEEVNILSWKIENFVAYLFCMFKQKNHSCENEYRIVVDDSDQKTSYRIRNGIFLPYQVLNFDSEKIPIEEIIIGPKISKDIYKTGLNEYLSSISRNEINVKTSEIRLN